jgi:hypothetical protein
VAITVQPPVPAPELVGEPRGRVAVANEPRDIDEGAENWACVASLIETCKLNDVEPQAYIADVLDKLVNLWPASRIDELMPWAWAKAHSADRLTA